MKALNKILILPGPTLRYYLSKFSTKIKYKRDKNRLHTAQWNSLMRWRNDIVYFLSRKFKKQILMIKQTVESTDNTLLHDLNDTIWIYWGQGIENAPTLVKVCVQSIINNLGGGV